MKKVIVNSLPKSGTHLLAKALDLAGYEQGAILGAPLVRQNSIGAKLRNLRLISFPRSEGYLLGIDHPVMIKKSYIQKLISSVKRDTYLSGHMGYTADLLEDLITLGFTPILITRDPRAVLSSFVHFVRSEKKHALHKKFNSINEDECYKITLNGLYTEFVHLQSLRIRCESLALWIRDERVLKVKFEDLIGEKGGGDIGVQRECLKKICEHLSIPEKKIDYIVDNLFGEGRHTFRKGKINSWEEEVPSNLMGSINCELGYIIKAWGYEL